MSEATFSINRIVELTLNPYPVVAADSFLLIIDIQEKLAAAMAEPERGQVIRNSSRLSSGAALFQMPVIVTEQYSKGLGKTEKGILSEGQGVFFEKIYFNAAAEDHILSHLQSLNRNTAIIAGMESHICVFFTALDLLRRGFRVVIADDAVSSRSAKHRDSAMRQLCCNGALILPTETILFSLSEKGGTDIFKKISALVK